jgi:hypothetical protein
MNKMRITLRLKQGVHIKKRVRGIEKKLKRNDHVEIMRQEQHPSFCIKWGKKSRKNVGTREISEMFMFNKVQFYRSVTLHVM